MKTQQPFRFIIAATAVFAFALLAACSSFSGPSNKWRIEISESAKSTGHLVFRLTPEDEAYTEVSVKVFKGTGENYVAHRIKDAFLEQLPKGQYKVEVDDGEDVLLKKDRAANFRLNLVSNTVDSVRVNLDRE